MNWSGLVKRQEACEDGTWQKEGKLTMSQLQRRDGIDSCSRTASGACSGFRCSYAQPPLQFAQLIHFHTNKATMHAQSR